MRRHRGRTLAGALVALACLLVVFAVLQLVHRSRPAPTLHDADSDPVYFDYGIVFTPRDLPPDAHYLTADEAWMKWEDGHHLSPDTTAEFGMPNNEGRYHLAWGFSRHGCMMPLGFPSARQVALAGSSKCREWTFLNPTTGRQILTTDVYPPKP